MVCSSHLRAKAQRRSTVRALLLSRAAMSGIENPSKTRISTIVRSRGSMLLRPPEVEDARLSHNNCAKGRVMSNGTSSTYRAISDLDSPSR